MPRYFVRVDVQVETDEPRLITVELEGRLLDGTPRPPGVWVDNATVVSIQEVPEEE